MDSKLQEVERKIFVVGPHTNKYGEYLKEKFKKNGTVVFESRID